MKMVYYFGIFIIFLFLTACSQEQPSSLTGAVIGIESQEQEKFISTTPIFPIDNPQFVSVEEANEWIDDNEPVLVLQYQGITRVYPLQIMLWHEFVHDKMNDESILVTYCPLCGSAAAYKEELIINGKIIPTSFTPAAKVYNSNPLFTDDITNTYWTQLEGKAIMGQLINQQLEKISTNIIIWRDWKKRYPDSQVLSQDTGYSRPYGKNPYPDYEKSASLLFPIEHQNDLLHPKEAIIGVTINNRAKAYPETLLKKVGVISDTLDNTPIKVIRDETGAITVQNLNTGQEIINTRSYWFTWYAFHPETEIYH